MPLFPRFDSFGLLFVPTWKNDWQEGDSIQTSDCMNKFQFCRVGTILVFGRDQQTRAMLGNKKGLSQTN